MEREIYLFVIKRVGVDDLSIPRCRLGATIEVVAGFFRFYESDKTFSMSLMNHI